MTASSESNKLRPAFNRIGGPLAWIIWGLAALSFGYAFFHRVAPSVMVSDLMRDFSVGGAALGNLSALYFYSYCLMQLPIGIILDRLGVRITLTIALSIAATGGLIFSTAHTIETAYIGRLLIGLGSGVGFLGSLVLIGQWFRPKRFALLSGMTMMIAMLSAVGSQAPLALLVESIGWRDTVFYGSVFGLVLGALILVVVRNAPDPSKLPSSAPVAWRAFARELVKAFKIPQVWITSTIACTMSGFMLGFGGLWGIPYMMTRYGIDRPEAGIYVSTVFLGWAVGAPLSGWLSDHLNLRKAPVVWAAFFNLVVVSILFLVPGLPLLVTGVLIFLGGALGAMMVNCYAYIREVTDPKVQGAVLGLINGFTVGAGALLQPLIGFLLDLKWTGEMAAGARVYSMAAFDFAMWAIILTCLLGLLASFLMWETRCEPLER